jgi:hypothetical protein
MFKEARWYELFARFQGFDDRIMLHFAQGFNGRVAQEGNLVTRVSKETVVNATGLPREGERWFKNQLAECDICNWFLKSAHQNASWAKGVPHAWMKDECVKPFLILQKYLMCEGRYVVVFQYHI